MGMSCVGTIAHELEKRRANLIAVAWLSVVCWLPWRGSLAGDRLFDLQSAAVTKGFADWGYWGVDPKTYATWDDHSNRLIPIYTFGMNLKAVGGELSAYRSIDRLAELYGEVPKGTFNPDAEYFDQTDVYRLQKMAVASGKKRVILFVFDGMDWQTTWAASIVRSGKVGYRHGRGSGLHFQDYRGTQTDFGFFVTSPHNDGTNYDVNTQQLSDIGGVHAGGYSAEYGGRYPWSTPIDRLYPIGDGVEVSHTFTDSASSATSMTAGIKTYNASINIGPNGKQVVPIARDLQDLGWAVGVVTSVPISHATPGCAYANNVARDDYQDITNDMLGLRSISHPDKPLKGLDCLIGAGHSVKQFVDIAQGENFEVGNRYLARSAEKQLRQEGQYELAFRTTGASGLEVLAAATDQAVKHKKRLFGFFGVKKKHLPYQTANGDYKPAVDQPDPDSIPVGQPVAEQYTEADLFENPTLADMTGQALKFLSRRNEKFWLMIEAGDVDWANHENNIDNSVGAVFSGDSAFKTLTEWIEANGGWKDTVVILTADHGHYLNITKPEALVGN